VTAIEKPAGLFSLAAQQPVRLARMSAVLEAWKQANPPARVRKNGGEAAAILCNARFTPRSPATAAPL